MVFYLVFLFIYFKNKIWVSLKFKTENKAILHYFEQYVSNKHQTCPLICHIPYFFFDKLQFINLKKWETRGDISLQTSTRQGGRLAKVKMKESLEAKQNLLAE